MQAFLLDLLTQAQGSPGLGYAGLAAAAFTAALAFVPRNLVSLIGGFLFGWIALPITVLAGTCGSVTASLLARRLLRARLSAHAQRRPAWRALLAAIDQEGWRVVALLRLAGPLPCSAQGYLLGLTDAYPPFRLYMGGHEPPSGTAPDTVPTTPAPVSS